MLPLAPSSSSAAVLDALADLAAALCPGAGEACLPAILGAARGRALRLLRELRHHLYENSLILRALLEASPASAEAARSLARSQRTLRQLSQLLGHRLREKDLAGVRDKTRVLLAYFLYCRSLARHSVSLAMGAMDDRATRRFADALFGCMLFDLSAGERQAVPGRRPDGLQALYVRLLSLLEIRPANSPFPRLNHEYSGR
jgi:hypothetical protein